MVLAIVAVYVGLGVLCFAMLRGCSRASRMEEGNRDAEQLAARGLPPAPLAHHGPTPRPVLDRAEARLRGWHDDQTFI